MSRHVPLVLLQEHCFEGAPGLFFQVEEVFSGHEGVLEEPSDRQVEQEFVRGGNGRQAGQDQR